MPTDSYVKMKGIVTGTLAILTTPAAKLGGLKFYVCLMVQKVAVFTLLAQSNFLLLFFVFYVTSPTFGDFLTFLLACKSGVIFEGSKCLGLEGWFLYLWGYFLFEHPVMYGPLQ